MTLNESMQVITAALTAEFAGTVEMTSKSIVAALDVDEARQTLAVCLGLVAGAIQMQADAYGITPLAFLQTMGRLNATDELT